MRRRDLVGLVAGAASFAWPLAAPGQPAPRQARVGCLMVAPADSPVSRQLLDALRQGLRDAGYVEGQGISFEIRSADGKLERLPVLAADLVSLKVDLIAGMSNAAVHGARQASTTLPIVSFNLGDPVGEGLAASLARPGGNVTGFTVFAPELVAKSLSLLSQALPAAARIAALWFPGSLTERTAGEMLQNLEAAARSLGNPLSLLRARDAADLEGVFSLMVGNRAGAVFVLPSPVSNAERRRIADLAARHRLPSMSWTREFAEAGGLMSYGSNLADSWRRGATYVDRILKGANPADLPIQQPTKFELVINTKTAKALGLTLPSALLVAADEVIE